MFLITFRRKIMFETKQNSECGGYFFFGGPDPIFFNKSFSYGQIRLHPKFHFPKGRLKKTKNIKVGPPLINLGTYNRLLLVVLTFTGQY